MKWLKVIPVLAVAMVTSFASWAQYLTVEQFVAFEVKNKVQLNWVMTAGNLCNGTAIFRSTDSINYEFVGEILGICGDISEPEAYNFLDEDPIYNTKVYYKLEFGGLSEAPTTSVTVYNITNGYLAFPNPASSYINIYFDNPDKEEYTITVYSSTGTRITELKTSDEYFYIDVTTYQNGKYFFIITHPEKAIIAKGRLQVIR